MTESAFRDDIPLLHLMTLRSSALLLQKEFAGMFSTETIERFLVTSYDEIASRLANETYLALFAERFARERLGALARVEGKSDDKRPVVLFLCTHNAGRSQMALGYFRALAGERAIGWSGGSEPGNVVNPSASAAMAGCGDACPLFPGKRYEDWDLTDPEGLGVDAVRPIRDEIKGRVEGLLASLDVLVG